MELLPLTGENRRPFMKQHSDSNSSTKFPDFSFFQNTPAPATLPRPRTSTPLAPSLPTSHSPTQCPKILPLPTLPPPSLTPTSLPYPIFATSLTLPPPSPSLKLNPPSLPPPNLPTTNPYRRIKRMSTISPVYSFSVPSKKPPDKK